MKDYIEDYKKAEDEHARNKIHSQIIEYTTWFPNRKKGYYRTLSAASIPTGASVETSDDTIKLEKRIHKRRLFLILTYTL